MKCALIVILFLPLFVLAQNKPLVIEGVSPDLFVNHIVAPKENYYSIGRIYNISPKDIAPFNNLVLENGLSLGQALKIPLSPANFLQNGNAAPDEVLIPVYHSVEGKEGLYRIGVQYNKIPVETLKQWNNLKADEVSNGTKLIVGYLKVKKDLSPLAMMAKGKPLDIPAGTETQNNTVTVKEPGKTEISAVVLPSGKGPVSEKPPLVEKVKKEPVPDAAVVNESLPAKKLSTPLKRKNFNGGVFKTDYEKQIRNKAIAGETGEAAVFKSTSGWEDGKYYCLHNASIPGTILKITNYSSGKSVYAKVLDTISDITQNTGLLLRISNAAADELGVGDPKFMCTLSYSK